jgi:nitroreductase
LELEIAIRGRRSVRAYSEAPVSKDDLAQILEAGTWAPTGMGREPWKFIVIEDKSLIKFVSDETKELAKKMLPAMAENFCTENDIICYNAPVIVFICTEKDTQWGHVSFVDSVLAAQNMFLKAYELGLGTCYMGFVAFLNSKPEVLRKIGVPDNCELTVPFILGHPKDSIGKGKRNQPNIIKWVK